MAASKLPRPTYVLDGADERVPPDYFALCDEAGGVDALPASFAARYAAAARAAGLPAGPEVVAREWAGYLSGEYGACLRRVSPEAMVRKARLMAAVADAVASPRPDDADWRARLRADVDALDALLRPFAPYDRVRFGGPVSRDRLVTAPRRRFPEVFAATSADVRGAGPRGSGGR